MSSRCIPEFHSRKTDDWTGGGLISQSGPGNCSHAGGSSSFLSSVSVFSGLAAVATVRTYNSDSVDWDFVYIIVPYCHDVHTKDAPVVGCSLASSCTRGSFLPTVFSTAATLPFLGSFDRRTLTRIANGRNKVLARNTIGNGSVTFAKSKSLEKTFN